MRTGNIVFNDAHTKNVSAFMNKVSIHRHLSFWHLLWVDAWYIRMCKHIIVLWVYLAPWAIRHFKSALSLTTPISNTRVGEGFICSFESKAKWPYLLVRGWILGVWQNICIPAHQPFDVKISHTNTVSCYAPGSISCENICWQWDL